MDELTEHRRYLMIQKRFAPYTTKHFQFLEQIEEEYSIWYNTGCHLDSRLIKLVQMCEADIALTPVMKQYFLSLYPNERLPSYGSYKRLSIIYEKLGDYESAHDVCLRALQSGFISEGGGKTVHSRLVRIEKKRGAQLNESPVQAFILENGGAPLSSLTSAPSISSEFISGISMGGENEPQDGAPVEPIKKADIQDTASEFVSYDSSGGSLNHPFNTQSGRIRSVRRSGKIQVLVCLAAISASFYSCSDSVDRPFLGGILLAIAGISGIIALFQLTTKG